MTRKARKRSASVRLAFMGAAAVGIVSTPGCGEDVQRNSYASLADCVADYSEAQCREDRPIGSTYTGSHYYGPWYRSNYASRGVADDPGEGRALHASRSGLAATGTHGPSGVESGTRGGFGGHGVSARG